MKRTLLVDGSQMRKTFVKDKKKYDYKDKNTKTITKTKRNTIARQTLSQGKTQRQLQRQGILLVDGSKLRERFSAGLGNKDPNEKSSKGTHRPEMANKKNKQKNTDLSWPIKNKTKKTQT